MAEENSPPAEPAAAAPAAAAAKCGFCNRPVKPGSVDPPNPSYVPKCALGGADMRKVYESATKEEWVCANLAPEAPITMDQYAKWRDNYLKSKFEYKKS